MVALLLLNKSSLCQNNRTTVTRHNYSRWRRPRSLKVKISDFLASRSSPSKTVNTALGNRLKHKLKLYAERLRIFRDTLILVFMNENSCLCKCFTELYLFFWLLVVSLAILIACPCRLFSSFMTIACRSTQKCRAYQTLYKITHRYNGNH